VDPMLVSIAEACRLSGLGRTVFYELIGAGAIETVKLGRRRLVVVASLAAFVDRLRAEAQS